MLYQVIFPSFIRILFFSILLPHWTASEPTIYLCQQLTPYWEISSSSHSLTKVMSWKSLNHMIFLCSLLFFDYSVFSGNLSQVQCRYITYLHGGCCCLFGSLIVVNFEGKELTHRRDLRLDSLDFLWQRAQTVPNWELSYPGLQDQAWAE